LIESRCVFPDQKSDVVLPGCIAHLLKRLKPGEDFVAPGPRYLS
jgi:hypothetical protein